jgi:hypothetical protein
MERLTEARRRYEALRDKRGSLLGLEYRRAYVGTTPTERAEIYNAEQALLEAASLMASRHGTQAERDALQLGLRYTGLARALAIELALQMGKQDAATGILTPT